jgi:tRNA modification GTPase
LLLRTKCDLGRPSGDGLLVSAVTGEGLDQVRRLAADRLFAAQTPLGDLDPVLTRERHRERLNFALGALGDAREQLGVSGRDAVLASHHVREATSALDELIGIVDVESILDRVFASFCVGK